MHQVRRRRRRLHRHRAGARRRARIHRALRHHRGHLHGAGDSPLTAIADFDKPGIRIAVGKGSAYHLYLERTIKHATLVPAPTGGQAIEMFVATGWRRRRTSSSRWSSTSPRIRTCG